MTPTQIATATDALLAITASGEVVELARFDSYNDAVAAWYRHDDRRLAGRRPHVRHYEVRSTDDPKVRRATRLTSTTAYGLDVVGSRGYGKDEAAARADIHRRHPSSRQGSGGWFWDEDTGRTLAQGLWDLARIARRRGWIVQSANGRWFPTVSREDGE